MSEPWQLTLVLWSVQVVVFAATWGVHELLHRFELTPRARVVEGKAPPVELQRRATWEAVIGHVLLVPVLRWVVVPLWLAMGGDPSAPPPPLYEMAWQVVACILIQDTLFYWSHRALHTKWLFRKVHRKHHDFRYVRGVSAVYAHTVESTANLVSMMAGPILLVVHPWTFTVWVAIRVWESVEAHSGHAFTTLASRHAYHHLYAARGCLGSFFGVWDRLMGTDAHWRQWRRDQPHP